MQYLTKTLPLYAYNHLNEDGKIAYTQCFHWNQVEHDEYEGIIATVAGESVRVEAVDEEPATWWTVGVYTRYSVYGGPEEGGWWYDAGSLTDHASMQFFDNFEKAQAYSQALWERVHAHNANCNWDDEQLTVRCTSNALPQSYYPLHRPYYC